MYSSCSVDINHDRRARLLQMHPQSKLLPIDLIFTGTSSAILHVLWWLYLAYIFLHGYGVILFDISGDMMQGDVGNSPTMFLLRLMPEKRRKVYCVSGARSRTLDFITEARRGSWDDEWRRAREIDSKRENRESVVQKGKKSGENLTS